MKKTKKTKGNDQIKELNNRVEDLDSKWKRALADYQNLQKRVENERSTFIRLANASLIEKVLNIKDDLERAANHLNDAGIDMIIKQLDDVLNEEGVEEIDALNQTFNPESMECVETKPGKKDIVLSVSQKGYAIKDFILRPAKVEVGDGKK